MSAARVDEAGTLNGVRRRAHDLSVWLALTLTVVWLLLGFLYIGSLLGWERFTTQPVADLGQFLEGAFAPLAFLWLVIGNFQQQRELSANNDAIRLQYEVMQRTAEQAEIQSRAVAANELHARQDTFIDLAALVSRQCSAAIGLLYVSSQAAGSGPMTTEEVGRMWGIYGAGDPEVFVRAMLVLQFQGDSAGNTYDLYYGTPVRTRHTENIHRAYGRLLHNAADCDPDGMITDALRGSPLGRIYAIIEEHRERWLAEGSPNKPA